MNTYGYVGGNPINSIDPLGLIEDLFPEDGENPFDPDDATSLGPLSECALKCEKENDQFSPVPIVATAVGLSRIPAARTYYTLTDSRFTAAGRYSRRLVPRAASNIQRVARASSWPALALNVVEHVIVISRCVKKCKKKLGLCSGEEYPEGLGIGSTNLPSGAGGSGLLDDD